MGSWGLGVLGSWGFGVLGFKVQLHTSQPKQGPWKLAARSLCGKDVGNRDEGLGHEAFVWNYTKIPGHFQKDYLGEGGRRSILSMAAWSRARLTAAGGGFKP